MNAAVDMAYVLVGVVLVCALMGCAVLSLQFWKERNVARRQVELLKEMNAEAELLNKSLLRQLEEIRLLDAAFRSGE